MEDQHLWDGYYDSRLNSSEPSAKMVCEPFKAVIRHINDEMTERVFDDCNESLLWFRSSPLRHIG